MKRARFQTDMPPDDDLEYLRRRPAAPTYHSRPPPPAPQERIPGFLGLPAELKQQIYNLLLDSDRVQPPSAPYTGDHENDSNGEVRYPTHYKAWRWPPAHWASKTLRNDLIDAAQDRLATRQVRAELDLMVAGFVFFPTWLYLPPDLPGDVPFDLDVSLRIFSGEAFRANDGWPRQPGSGFRVLLKLLNQLVHEGPSFGRRRELLTGSTVWAVNTLRINVSFHDVYTPATHAATSHEIFRMLKALASSGLAHDIIKTIHVRSTYSSPDPAATSPITWSSIYPVSPRATDTQVQHWRQIGFLTTHQRTLADDYRPPWDSSSGGPRKRELKLISPLERRDSPVGVVAPASAGKNPQMDDYGLITPPTPRASAGAEGGGYLGSGKRRSTPSAPALSSSLGSGAGALDDYSLVMTPSMGGMLDDYSLVMTPVPSMPMEDDSDY